MLYREDIELLICPHKFAHQLLLPQRRKPATHYTEGDISHILYLYFPASRHKKGWYFAIPFANISVPRRLRLNKALQH